MIRILLATTPAAQTGQPLSVNLSCPGHGSGTQMVRNYRKQDDDDPNFVPRRIEVSGAVQVRIRGGQGELLLPPDYSAGSEWKAIKRLAITDDEITGRIQVGLISTADVRIDRIAGVLTLKGDNGAFTGRCIAADPSRRAF